ncbi:FadR/GntR family transcriptional regulator [Cohnella abietis]|uniref:GntR family transcriptional regulator n=1 Tax=Cohnella abietis TaxID=2507935 RepID=A0A3T1D4B8_9BACL|nr:FadR/GntR family transcriptional regulator [Cohnella abietis]BBI32901.1 GntR family transcriptional regulator [Cohnella abietis]
MSFQKIKALKGSEIVFKQIQEQITSQIYPPGSKLPTVVELAESFEVGRSTVREALSALKAMGWVTIRHGGGTFVSVQPPKEENLGWLANSEQLQELLEVRKLLEAGCASLAATRRTEANLTELSNILKQMEAALDQEEESDLIDIRFHLEIAKASHNAMLISMMESMTDRMQHSMKDSRRLWFFAERASTEQLLLEHKKIYEAIEAKDDKLASVKMIDHLSKVEKVIHNLSH